VAYSGGSFDDFAGAEPSAPSSNLVYRLDGNGVVRQGFDDNRTDVWFAHTITNLPMFASEITLRIRVRAISGQPEDDNILLAFVGAGGALQPPQWSRQLGNYNAVPGLLGAAWVAGTTNEFVLNLRALPNANGSTTDLLPSIRQRGYLDIVLQDDSAVDYVILEVKSCPCEANILKATTNGNCGAIVTYPLPVFTDLCDPNPVVTCAPASGTFLPIGTTAVTCSAGDHSGNTNTCSFTITVFEPAPQLTINRVGNNVVICWPATCAPKLLEQTTSLNPVIAWSLVGTPPVIVGNQYCVTLPIQPGNRFFRLRSY
jgi:hypothetical protein